MMTISRICRTAPLRDRNTKVCMWGDIPDVITPVKFTCVNLHCESVRKAQLLLKWPHNVAKLESDKMAAVQFVEKNYKACLC